MTLSDAYTIGRFGIGAGLLAFAFLYMFRKTRLDVFRSDLFATRDGMFNYAQQNGIPFDLPAYRDLRLMLNGVIRFAHQFDLASLVLASLISARPDGDDVGGVLRSIESVQDKLHQEFFLGVYSRASRRTLRYVLFEGPQVVVMVPAIFVYNVWKHRDSWLSELPPSVVARLASLGRPDSPEAKALLTS